ncbi:MAG: response regulator [Ignavibacteriaceae bacterium]|nr:response regulator [Ignavibacteriaceae bacterium]
MSSFKKILLAEDNAKDAELTRYALSESNLMNEIVHVKDGAEALDYLFHQGIYSDSKDDIPIAAFIDLKMPKVDGIEVLRAIKTNDKLKFLPVVILTSSKEERDMVESYRLGANAYVVKPVDFEKFVFTVKQLGIFWGLINEAPAFLINK